MQAYIDDSVNKASHEIMKYSFLPIKPHFGHLLPDQVTKEESRSYVKKRRAAKKSESTIRRELGLLKAALRWKSKATPAVVELPAMPPPKDYALTREEWNRFRKAAQPEPHIYLFAVLAYATAGRAQAILDLTWDRIDLRRGLIDLRTIDQTKRKGRAIIPMNRALRVAVEAARKAALTEHVIEWNEGPVQSVKRGFATAAKRAGLPKLTPHILRHSAAVHMAERGIPMSEISQYLGHTDEKITARVYAKFSPEHLRGAAGALDWDDDDEQS